MAATAMGPIGLTSALPMAALNTENKVPASVNSWSKWVAGRHPLSLGRADPIQTLPATACVKIKRSDRLIRNELTDTQTGCCGR